MSKPITPDPQSINLIGAGTVIEGDIKSNGDIRIDGTIKGSLNVKGKLVVGASGIIEGEIICQNADVSGTLKAKITVTDLLSLKASSKLNGDIVSGKLHIEPGANFSGSCSMGAVIKDMSYGANQSKSQEKVANSY
ncbi:MAG: polymer-forming cytoskeletal protein [Bacteroidia bacterium]|nr:polymer-forming cytoskeletal protein [Bacteroidia bacterium]